MKIFIFWAQSFNFDQSLPKYRPKNSKCGRVKPRSDIPSFKSFSKQNSKLWIQSKPDGNQSKLKVCIDGYKKGAFLGIICEVLNWISLQAKQSRGIKNILEIGRPNDWYKISEMFFENICDGLSWSKKQSRDLKCARGASYNARAPAMLPRQHARDATTWSCYKIP